MNETQNKKTVWVTGVNQGIGAAILKLLEQEGFHVIGFDINTSKVPSQLQGQVYECDISDESKVHGLCQQLLETNPPDAFISVAGILHINVFEDATIEEWQHTFAVNLFGPVTFMQGLTAHFKARSTGSIVFVSSNATHVPRKGMAVYGASKAALTYLSKTLALELASSGVRVNTVSPGSTLTPMQINMWGEQDGEMKTIKGDLSTFKLGIPLQKLAVAEDVANAVSFLISDKASHITMHDLVIDGGATLGA